MAPLTILEYPDERLRQPAEPVTRFDAELRHLADAMIETLHATGSAIGLCATQVGTPLRMLVMDVSPERDAPRVFVNPRVLARGGYGIAEETCLSVPDLTIHRLRPMQVAAEWQDLRGDVHGEELAGLPAVCLLHELDHFAGELLVDHMLFGRLRYDWRRKRRKPTVATTA